MSEHTLAGTRVRLELIGEGASLAGTIVRAGDGATVGNVRLTDRGEALFVDELCIEPGARGYGCGSEAARLVREFAAAGGWRVLRAWAPPDLGLAVYFWSRMGLRPLHGEGPGGGLLFERQLRR